MTNVSYRKKLCDPCRLVNKKINDKKYREKNIVVPKVVIPCKKCGNDFLSVGSRKFCSPCRNRKKNPNTIYCLHCDKGVNYRSRFKFVCNSNCANTIMEKFIVVFKKIKYKKINVDSFKEDPILKDMYRVELDDATIIYIPIDKFYEYCEKEYKSKKETDEI